MTTSSSLVVEKSRCYVVKTYVPGFFCRFVLIYLFSSAAPSGARVVILCPLQTPIDPGSSEKNWFWNACPPSDADHA